MGCLADEISAYQALLEGHRMDPDNEELYEDLLKARNAMLIAWDEHRHARRFAPQHHHRSA